MEKELPLGDHYYEGIRFPRGYCTVMVEKGRRTVVSRCGNIAFRKGKLMVRQNKVFLHEHNTKTQNTGAVLTLSHQDTKPSLVQTLKY